jgi:hypothetical protein
MKKKTLGRPTSYKKAYCEMLEKHMTAGYSFGSFRPDEVKDPSVLYRWLEQYPDFRKAKKRGEIAGMKQWEGTGMKMALGLLPKANVTAWIFIMKNRFGWRDQVNIMFNEVESLDFHDEKDVTPIVIGEIDTPDEN